MTLKPVIKRTHYQIKKEKRNVRLSWIGVSCFTLKRNRRRAEGGGLRWGWGGSDTIVVVVVVVVWVSVVNWGESL